MSVFTPSRSSAQVRRPHALVLFVTVVAAVAVAAWVIASDVGTRGPSARSSVSTQASSLRSLTAQERQYVAGMASLNPVQLRAAFGTDEVSGLDSTLASLTPQERSYARAIESMSYQQLAAAFGTGR